MVIGAGPAGLATSRELTRAGLEHVVLERGEQVGETWANLYDSLVLHTARRLSALPGLAFPPSTPLFPGRNDFLQYLHRYAETFRVPVSTRTKVMALRRTNGRWTATTTSGEAISASFAVVATGIVSNPVQPEIPHRHQYSGRVMHSVDYRRPDGFAGQRVLVVGVGNSAGEISAELAHAGAAVTVAVRSGTTVVPRDVAGVPIQYLAVPLAHLPKRLQAVVAAWSRGCPSWSAGRPSCRVPAALAVARSRSSAFTFPTRFGRERFVSNAASRCSRATASGSREASRSPSTP